MLEACRQLLVDLLDNRNAKRGITMAPTGQQSGAMARARRRLVSLTRKRTAGSQTGSHSLAIPATCRPAEQPVHGAAAASTDRRGPRPRRPGARRAVCSSPPSTRAARTFANQVPVITGVVKGIAHITLDDGLRFDADSARGETTREDDRYSGVRVHLDCHLATAHIRLKVDVNVCDPVSPAPAAGQTSPDCSTPQTRLTCSATRCTWCTRRRS